MQVYFLATPRILSFFELLKKDVNISTSDSFCTPPAEVSGTTVAEVYSNLQTFLEHFSKKFSEVECLSNTVDVEDQKILTLGFNTRAIHYSPLISKDIIIISNKPCPKVAVSFELLKYCWLCAKALNLTNYYLFELLLQSEIYEPPSFETSSSV
jgi:hypothetical protein